MEFAKSAFTNATKSYFTTSAFGLLNNMKSTFGKMDIYDSDEVQSAVAMNQMFIGIMVIVGIIIGFMAVPHLCPDQSERGKNVRLGLYVLLIVTGGQLGWFMALLWLFKINICV